ncbi:MAG: GNAT family N-acetyltransferase [Bacteroidota bacterium]
MSTVPELETDRLRLRQWHAADIEAYAAFCADEATGRFVGGVCNREDAWRRMSMIVGHWTLRGYGVWALEEKSSRRFVGFSGLWNPEGWPEPEVMWSLVADAHGRGYATEAAGCARDFAYRQLGWTTAISLIAPDNVPSRRVAKRLGAVCERQVELRGLSVGVYRHPGPTQLEH